MVAFLVVSSIVWVLVRNIGPKEFRSGCRAFALYALIAWVIGVLTVTIPSNIPVIEGVNDQEKNFGMIPFTSLDRLGSEPVAALEVVCNIIMFTLGGYILSSLARWNVWYTTICLVVFGAAIEIVQFLSPFPRVATVDDIILYFLGAVVGAFMWKKVSGDKTRGDVVNS
ncbi:VanZ family protein [Micrococcus sp.]|uniref:VanZ family protein n=1 Tax=Micrococcus sp. TaxID=1271 RepID=UPI002A91F034|nr:VanZ family protein [Micrococcus sp.]